MTINELNEFMHNHGFCNTNNEEDLPKKYVADLVEAALKDGYNKAIDEFANWLYENYKKDLTDYIEWYKKDIAKQSKGGADDGK